MEDLSEYNGSNLKQNTGYSINYGHYRCEYIPDSGLMGQKFLSFKDNFKVEDYEACLDWLKKTHEDELGVLKMLKQRLEQGLPRQENGDIHTK
jgi:hypothetical protein